MLDLLPPEVVQTFQKDFHAARVIQMHGCAFLRGEITAGATGFMSVSTGLT